MMSLTILYEIIADFRLMFLWDVQAFSLQEQIDHKVAYIQQHLSGAGRGPVAIIGHSIGDLRIPRRLSGAAYDVPMIASMSHW